MLKIHFLCNVNVLYNQIGYKYVSEKIFFKESIFMKKTLAILFAVVLAVCMCVPSFALTLDTAESATEVNVIPEDASL